MAAETPNFGCRSTAYEVGHWVVLHKNAFGAHVQRGLNKLETWEAFGPYQILEVDTKRGRLKVELGTDFTRGKTNVFSMEHVRQHWTKRPWRYETLTLDERLAPEAQDPDYEWEVDGVSSRRYLRGKYKYAVTYKGGDEETKLLPKDSPDLRGCQELLNEFDEKHPLGSLPFDKPEDQRAWHERTRSQHTRRSTRVRNHSRGP